MQLARKTFFANHVIDAWNSLPEKSFLATMSLFLSID